MNEFFLSASDLLLNAVLLAVSATLIIKGQLTTGTYAAVNVIISTALQPIRSLAQIIEILQSAKLSFSTSNELLQVKAKANDGAGKLIPEAPVLEVVKLSYQYASYR